MIIFKYAARIMKLIGL